MNVTQDLVNSGVQFKENAFTKNLLRMMTADSVNMLKNIREVQIEDKKNENKVPWKSVVQSSGLNGHTAGDTVRSDFDTLKNSAEDDHLPEI